MVGVARNIDKIIFSKTMKLFWVLVLMVLEKDIDLNEYFSLQ
ncbi:hypothetical protein STA3757_22660 [Stanieria sp. NIES-3757]|nr:hypothetical protein STA3757_22660 [Stanieria sp. NIES-3757]